MLDLDFSYKAVFNEYVGKIYEITKEQIMQASTVKNQLKNVQTKLELKDQEI